MSICSLRVRGGSLSVSRILIQFTTTFLSEIAGSIACKTMEYKNSLSRHNDLQLLVLGTPSDGVSPGKKIFAAANYILNQCCY